MDSYLEYEGSITIDRELMATAGMVEYELVQIVNINNDARFVTYINEGEAGSGKIELNGAVARLAHPVDRVIAMFYVMVNEEDLSDWKSTIVLVDDINQVKDVLC